MGFATQPNSTEQRIDALEQKKASTTDLGLVKVGTTLEIDSDGILNSNVAGAEKKAVADEAEMLALPQVNALYIVTRADVNRLYYLNANDNPSVVSNWQQGASTGDTVSSFNDRVGAVVPAQGDYSLSDVTESDQTTSLEYKLVIDAGVLYMEEL